MATKKSDLYVFTKAKELAIYVFKITEKSPKKYRFTLTTRLQNYCLDAIEYIYTANSLPLNDERLSLQKKAGVTLEKIGYFSMLAMEVQCILPNQHQQISKLQAESLLFLGKWISSDKKRRNPE